MVQRYARGETELAGAILEPFRTERLEAIWSNLVAIARPALSIEVQRGAPSRRTKLGGLPDLPDGAEWPRRGQKPLSFVAQIDLEEVHDYLRDPALPETGLLSFFYEADLWTSGHSPQHEGAWRVLLLNGPLSRQSPPAASPREVPDYYDPSVWGYEEAGVKFVPRVSLPEAEHLLAVRAGIGPDDYEVYGALMDELRHGHGLSGLTQLLGYPAEIQHDPFITTQLVANRVDTLRLSPENWRSEQITHLLEEREPWRLLLQVGSSNEIGMEWADSGVVYYCIRDQDLRAKEWDRVWLVMEDL
jgi:uncharacterized protein YwqG